MRARGTLVLLPMLATAAIAISLSFATPVANAEDAPLATAEATGAPITVVIPADTGAGSSPGNQGGGSNPGGDGSNPGSTPVKNPDGSPIAPASPGEPASGLTLDHETIEAKQFMIATGTGYSPGEKIQVVLYPGAIVIGSYAADASGAFEARFRIPEDTATGIHTIEATGWDSGHVTNKEFTVTSPAFAAGVPVLWWVLAVSGVILTSLISAAVYFRFSLFRIFSGRPAMQGATS